MKLTRTQRHNFIAHLAALDYYSPTYYTRAADIVDRILEPEKGRGEELRDCVYNSDDCTVCPVRRHTPKTEKLLANPEDDGPNAEGNNLTGHACAITIEWLREMADEYGADARSIIAYSAATDFLDYIQEQLATK